MRFAGRSNWPIICARCGVFVADGDVSGRRLLCHWSVDATTRADLRVADRPADGIRHVHEQLVTAWLTTTMNRTLMLIEPYGFRWLRETWLKVDLGTAFYNTQSMPVDAAFAVSRLAFTLCGVVVVAASARHFAHTFRSVRQGSCGGQRSRPTNRPARSSCAAANRCPSCARSRQDS